MNVNKLILKKMIFTLDVSFRAIITLVILYVINQTIILQQWLLAFLVLSGIGFMIKPYYHLLAEDHEKR
jgi:hypothetical protein